MSDKIGKFVALKMQELLDNLDKKQSLYAAYLGLASWAGFPILLQQISRESLSIHEFLAKFMEEYPNDILESCEPNSTVSQFLDYIACFYRSCGNYSHRNDSKLFPGCSSDNLEEILTPYPKLLNHFSEIKDVMYSSEPNIIELGFYPSGVTAYYEPEDFTNEEAQGIDKVILQANLKLENTFIIRHEDRYEVQLYSVEIDETGHQIGEFNSKPVFLTKGKNSETIKKIIYWLELAKGQAANQNQVNMLDSLIKHYTTGNCLDHVKYSEHWVYDVDPVIETHHGFIETYRDPDGVRAEYEGFVACVDQKESRCLHNFVDGSSWILKLLPYPPEYERETFTPPSYNALCVLTFCGAGIPLGINIPNYDEIRSKVGFKNVTLTNVSNASQKEPSVFSFLYPEDQQLLSKLYNIADDVATAMHELYGHGSGKLLRKEDVVGKQVPDLLTPGKFVKTYYKENETAEQAYGSVYSILEECRAETTSLYLPFYKEVLDVFELDEDPEYRKMFLYASLLIILHHGISQTVAYSISQHSWSQSHAAARFAILRAVLMWGKGAATIDIVEDKINPFRLRLDINRLEDVRIAVTKLLVHLNYFKSTNQPDSAREFVGMMTSMDDYWLTVRKASQVTITPNTVLCGGSIIKDGDKDYHFEETDLSKGSSRVTFIRSTQKNIELASKCE